MPALPGMSVHREDILREAEAFRAGVLRGIELAAEFNESRGHADAAAELRAARVVEEEPAKAVAVE